MTDEKKSTTGDVEMKAARAPDDESAGDRELDRQSQAGNKASGYAL